MLCIKDITLEEAGRFLVEDPLLCERALPDEELENIKNGNGYCPMVQSNYIGVYHYNLLICITKWECFTSITGNIHTYISSLLHGKNVTIDIQAALKEWFIKNTSFHKLLILSPGSCPNVHKAADISGFVLEGTLTNAMIWRGQVDDIRTYSLDLKSLRRE